MSFYITLPSDSSKSKRPDNRLNHYITDLARAVDLDGDWEVGLSEVVLPPLVVSLPGKSLIQCFKNAELFTLELPSQTFTSFNHFQEFLKNKIPEDPFTKEAMFEFSFDLDVVTLTVKPAIIVNFSGSIRNVLRLSDFQYAGPHKYVSKMGSSIDFLYLYCDVVEHGLVGDTMAPLLRAIPIIRKDNFWVVERYESPHYIELQKLNFSTIEIEICNDLAGRVTFQQGRTLVKIHSRPKKR